MSPEELEAWALQQLEGTPEGDAAAAEAAEAAEANAPPPPPEAEVVDLPERHDAPLLSNEEISGVLDGAVLDASPGPDTGPHAYSLREPVAFPPEVQAAARARMEAMAGALGQVLARSTGFEVTVRLEGFQQQRTAAALSAFPPPVWVLPFARPEGGGAALAFHPGIALALVEAFLGGSGKPADAVRQPTRLESRVMRRMAEALAPAFGAAAGARLVPAELAIGAVDASVAAPDETVGVGLLRVELPQGVRSAMLLAGGTLLAPADAGANAPRGTIGPLAPRLAGARVTARPVLRAGRLTLAEIAALEPGSVVVLDAADTTPIDLRVQGQRVFSGRVIRAESGAAFEAASRRARNNA
jgi:flagellar motor switch protein FliM